jgi:hypothetical protein
MQLVGANPAAPAAGLEPLVTRVNYFLGSDPSGWHTNVPTFGRVRYAGVYAGIDVSYYATQGQLEYDFTVAPGADPAQIRLAFSGADGAALDAAGDLVLQAGGTQVVQHAPSAYQDVGGIRQPVASRFALGPELKTQDSKLITFELGPYDHSRPLVVDPVIAGPPAVLAYSTYLGGPSSDQGYALAVDAAGSVYLTGQAGSGFPEVDPLQPYGGYGDAYVAKLSPDGSQLVYATYVGGSYEEVGYGIAVDPAGSAYITGFTESGNFPTTPGAFQTLNGHGTCSGDSYCADAFVTKLAPDGSALAYSTYLGVGSIEGADAIAVDAQGNAYVKGITNAPNFYVVNAVQPKYGGDGGCYDPSYHKCFDAFVTKFNPSGTGLVYSTYLGGSLDEGFSAGQSGSIAVDAAGQAYVTGYTTSANFPTYHPFQGQRKGAEDVYVTKLSADGSSLAYSTYLGGTVGEEGDAIKADAAGSAYVAGITYSKDFPVRPDSFQTTLKGDSDAFLTKFAPDGSSLAYSTYLGGTLTDSAYGLAVDQAGSAYVVGTTRSPDFPVFHGFQPTFGGGTYDAFLAAFAPSGKALAFSSFLGGGDWDLGSGVAVDGAGAVYVSGETLSPDFPLVHPLQAQKGGYWDAYTARIQRLALQGHPSGTPVP